MPQPLYNHNVWTDWSSFAPSDNYFVLTSWIDFVPEVQTTAGISMCAGTKKQWMYMKANSEEPYKSMLSFQTISNISSLYLTRVNIHSLLRQWRYCVLSGNAKHSQSKEIRLYHSTAFTLVAKNCQDRLVWFFIWRQRIQFCKLSMW